MTHDFLQTGPADECAKHGKGSMYFRKRRGGFYEGGKYIIENDSYICYVCIEENYQKAKEEFDEEHGAHEMVAAAMHRWKRRAERAEATIKEIEKWCDEWGHEEDPAHQTYGLSGAVTDIRAIIEKGRGA